jgi:hypothetical protein
MKSRGVKIKISRRARQWALTTGIAFMLIASPQVWTGIACLCAPQLGCEDSFGLTAHHSDATAEMQSKSSTPETAISCETTAQEPGVAQRSFQSRPVEVCCVPQPQREPPARYVSAQTRVYALSAPSAEGLLWFTTPASVSDFYPTYRSSERPLYLAFSCLLI